MRRYFSVLLIALLLLPQGVAGTMFALTASPAGCDGASMGDASFTKRP